MSAFDVAIIVAGVIALVLLTWWSGTRETREERRRLRRERWRAQR